MPQQAGNLHENRAAISTANFAQVCGMHMNMHVNAVSPAHVCWQDARTPKSSNSVSWQMKQSTAEPAGCDTIRADRVDKLRILFELMTDSTATDTFRYRHHQRTAYTLMLKSEVQCGVKRDCFASSLMAACSCQCCGSATKKCSLPWSSSVYICFRYYSLRKHW
jgi:hypothetical protein